METENWNEQQWEFHKENLKKSRKNWDPQYWYNKRRKRKYFGALIIVLIGVVLLLHRLPLNLPGWVFSWKLLLIVIGILVGLRNRFQGWSWFCLIVIGAGFIVSEHYVPAQYQNLVLPVGIILIGLYAFFAHLFFPKNHFCRGKKNKAHTKDTSDEDTIRIDNVFGGVNRVFLSKNFKGGLIKNVFGATKVNLLQCDFQESAELRIENTFGGVTLIVPSNWKVIQDIDVAFGGVDDRCNAQPEEDDKDKKHLILKGKSTFGGIEIKNFDKHNW